MSLLRYSKLQPKIELWYAINKFLFIIYLKNISKDINITT